MEQQQWKVDTRYSVDLHESKVLARGRNKILVKTSKEGNRNPEKIQTILTEMKAYNTLNLETIHSQKLMTETLQVGDIH